MKRFACCVLLGLACVAAAGVVAQESRAPKARVNLMIEKLARGLPVVTDVDWMWIEKEHAPYDVREIARDMSVLQLLRNDKRQMLYPAVVRIPCNRVEADPALAPGRVLHQLAIAPAPGDLLTPSGELVVPKFVRSYERLRHHF